ncbi:MAG: hypothetical protein OHK0052_01030 [Anaerolineales bacterium]
MSLPPLYPHQTAALQAAERGENFIIATGPASGKTLAYQIPTLQRLHQNPHATALYLAPTKALAQDQLTRLKNLLAQEPNAPAAALYDGDTPASARPKIRQNARYLLTNPDMLHLGILPYHTQWQRFLSGLTCIILDEVHTYRGIFGSHLANLLRRLRRICNFYGSTPQYFLASATLANPQQHAQSLIQAPVTLIDRDESPPRPVHLTLHNPPLTDPKLGLRLPPEEETLRLAAENLQNNHQTLIFTRSRRSVEHLLTQLHALTPHAYGYRSGYLPAERRAIETALRNGSARIVVATNALELGIDIGSLDSVILLGYPGSIAATRQQIGRASRKGQPATATLIATPAPLDQYLIRHPEYLLHGSPEHALTDPNHPLILLDHLRCAAYEIPFEDGEPFGDLPFSQIQPALQALQHLGEIHRGGLRWYWNSEIYPAQRISLRSAAAQRVALYTQNTLIGELDTPSSHWLAHPGAIYLHQARPYLVQNLNLTENRAELLPADTIPYYTEANIHSELHLQQTQQHTQTRAHGQVIVQTQVVGYRKLDWHTHHVIGIEPLEMPIQNLHTTACWLWFTPPQVETLRAQGLWRNSRNDYGSNWDAQRNAARARDGYRCQVCGILEGARAHHVHHKIPFKKFGDPLQANQLENLLTLCPTCHRRVEMSVRLRSGLSGLAFLLSHLAPLFILCDPADLGSHTDPQSALTEGQPTVAFYERVPGGIGLSAKFYDLLPQILTAALETIRTCPCEDGCPSCAGPGGENGEGGKPETRAMLELLTSDK